LTIFGVGRRFKQSLTDTLSQTTLNLTFNDHRVYDIANIVSRSECQNLDNTCIPHSPSNPLILLS
jgi:hypothetical protein